MCREIKFSVFDTETLNLNLFFEIVLLSPRPGNHLNTFLASFTSSGVESQPEWTNIHSIHASGGQSRVSSRRNPTLEQFSVSSGCFRLLPVSELCGGSKRAPEPTFHTQLGSRGRELRTNSLKLQRPRVIFPINIRTFELPMYSLVL